MRTIKRALWYGLLLWLIPFVVSFIIYPLKKLPEPLARIGVSVSKLGHISLFETIMAVTVTVCVVVLAVLYFKKVKAKFLAEAIVVGILWFLMSIFIDLFLFMWGPMQMTFPAYLMDIGLTYLIYPAVVIGFGLVLQKRDPAIPAEPEPGEESEEEN